MNISFVQLKSVVRAIDRLRASVDRLADLYELELQSVHRLTTRTAPASKSELEDTQVEYSSAEFAETLRTLERRAGRSLRPDEVEKVETALLDDEAEE